MNKKLQRYINHIVENIDPPYVQNMKELYKITSEGAILSILCKLYDIPVIITSTGNDSSYNIQDDKGNTLYYETPSGQWTLAEYDSNGNKTYYEDISGLRVKREYDTNGEVVKIEVL